MKHLSIANVVISQQQGLYSLNDLHKASGGEAKHQPALFLRLETTQSLIEEIEKTKGAAFHRLETGNAHSTDMYSAVKTINGGRNRGTYACKELVIAYGAWISPAFHLTVINVFLNSLHKRKPQTPLKQLSEASKAFKDVYQLMRVLDLDKNAAAISANQAIRKESDVDMLALTGHTHLTAENQGSGYYTPTELGKPLGLSAIKVNRRLAVAGLQARVADEWQATAAGKAHCRRFDTAKRHSDGAPVTQLKWASSVLPLMDPTSYQQTT